jgi:hypothetical protein
MMKAITRGEDDSPSMGYGLPENSADVALEPKMSSVLQVCEAKPPATKREDTTETSMKGQYLHTRAYANDGQETSNHPKTTRDHYR